MKEKESKKGLTDEELVKKYEGGKIHLKEALKKTIIKSTKKASKQKK